MPRSTPGKGRGASFNPHQRYLNEIREVFDDGWTEANEKLPPPSTTVTVEQARTIIKPQPLARYAIYRLHHPYRQWIPDRAQRRERVAHRLIAGRGAQLSTGRKYRTQLARGIKQHLK